MLNDFSSNLFENGGTVIQHIIDMSGVAVKGLLLIAKHVTIIWETILF